MTLKELREKWEPRLHEIYGKPGSKAFDFRLLPVVTNFDDDHFFVSVNVHEVKDGYPIRFVGTANSGGVVLNEMEKRMLDVMNKIFDETDNELEILYAEKNHEIFTEDEVYRIHESGEKLCPAGLEKLEKTYRHLWNMFVKENGDEDSISVNQQFGYGGWVYDADCEWLTGEDVVIYAMGTDGTFCWQSVYLQLCQQLYDNLD